jgi:hypothetical protein
MYLNIRIHSYRKILNSSILKVSIKKRQKLHKSILFNNLKPYIYFTSEIDKYYLCIMLFTVVRLVIFVFLVY